ncbi:unnamed protein product [Mesocestoides corti]|uniref:Uncharacterized protein n=1 Tax=Mesocestoides corti TaxID=53468 RepID=A0A0R3UDT9_MESCO|nr:unnamed protein product [Mesocestoides corti]
MQPSDCRTFKNALEDCVDEQGLVVPSVEQLDSIVALMVMVAVSVEHASCVLFKLNPCRELNGQKGMEKKQKRQELGRAVRGIHCYGSHLRWHGAIRMDS